MLINEKIVVAGAGGLLGGKIVSSILDNKGSVIAIDINKELMESRLIGLGVDVKSDVIQLERVDVTNEESSKEFFSTLSGVTGAVNASYPKNKSFGLHFFDVSLESFNENLSLHLGSAFLFAQQCAAYFKKHGGRMSLVNMSSIYGVVAPRFKIYAETNMTTPVEYAAIKSAIIHLNKYVAAYINDSNFRINSISPGGILDNQPESFLENYKEHTLGKGMLDASDILGPIMFLLSEHAKYINGQNIIVDDGFSN